MWKCPPGDALVPVDFGDASGRAIEVAGELAARLGARLHLLHVETIETPPYFTPDQIAVLERERRAARARAGAFALEFGRQHAVEIPDVAIREGAPATVILEAAREADLVVMGTHGRRGPSRWWMGSVAERVVRESPVPVLVVRGDAAVVEPARLFDQVVVHSPGQGPDEAARAAAAFGAVLGGRVGGEVRCASNAADVPGATLIVVPRAGEAGRVMGHAAEQWLRSCRLPMLFVPHGCTSKEEGQ